MKIGPEPRRPGRSTIQIRPGTPAGPENHQSKSGPGPPPARKTTNPNPAPDTRRPGKTTNQNPEPANSPDYLRIKELACYNFLIIGDPAGCRMTRDLAAWMFIYPRSRKSTPVSRPTATAPKIKRAVLRSAREV